MRQFRVLMLGDQIRLACQPRTAEMLAAEEGLIISTDGPAESCGTSRNIAEHIDAWLDQHAPDAVHFNAGHEDCKWHRAERHNVVPLGEYELHLQHIIDACKPRLGGDIIFATSTPVIDALQTDQPENAFDLSCREIEEYNVAAQQIMLMNDVLINRLDQLIAMHDDEYLAADGISLTPAGVEGAARQTADCIRGLWH